MKVSFFFCTGERRQSGDCRHGAKVRLFKVCVYVFSVCLFCFFYIFFLNAFFWCYSSVQLLPSLIVRLHPLSFLPQLFAHASKKSLSERLLACCVVCHLSSLLKVVSYSDRRTSELREKIEAANGEIQQLDMDLEEHQG